MSEALLFVGLVCVWLEAGEFGLEGGGLQGSLHTLEGLEDRAECGELGVESQSEAKRKS